MTCFIIISNEIKMCVMHYNPLIYILYKISKIILITVILIGQFNYFSIVLYTKIRKELLFYNIHFQQRYT